MRYRLPTHERNTMVLDGLRTMGGELVRPGGSGLGHITQIVADTLQRLHPDVQWSQQNVQRAIRDLETKGLVAAERSGTCLNAVRVVAQPLVQEVVIEEDTAELVERISRIEKMVQALCDEWGVQT